MTRACRTATARPARRISATAIGTGRKVAIQILEFFDRLGYSRRIGDAHKVFKDSLLKVG